MKQEMVEAVIGWQTALGNREPLELTFHGGEPLVPGAGFFRMALPSLRRGLAPRKVKLAIQSNLWLLSDELCGLFREYDVSIGTSLDGYEEVNDAQRGMGYFARTMAGIERAQAHGISVGVIATFTKQSAPHAEAIFDFFARKGLSFSVHEVVGKLNQIPGGRFTPEGLTLDECGDLFVRLFDHYLRNMTRIRVPTFDQMARSISAGQGGLCTFSDCLGDYLTITPDGGIFSCNRFVTQPEWRLGWVQDVPTIGDLKNSPAWRRLRNVKGRQRWSAATVHGGLSAAEAAPITPFLPENRGATRAARCTKGCSITSRIKRWRRSSPPKTWKLWFQAGTGMVCYGAEICCRSCAAIRTHPKRQNRRGKLSPLRRWDAAPASKKP